MSKLTDLTEVTTLADGDLGMVVDVSNTSMDATGTNSKVTLSNVYAYIKTKTDLLYATIAGAGDVFKVGTPVNNQVGVWTGDGTIEGDADLIFDGTNLGIGTTSPTHALTFPTASTGIALYNTADQVTNYERGIMAWSSNVFDISTGRAGTGASRSIRMRALGSGNTASMTLNESTPLDFTTGGLSGADTTLFSLRNTSANNGTGIQTFFSLLPNQNQATTAGYTALKINVTETATGSGAKNLILAQVGGIDKLSVANTGITTITNTTDAASNQVLVLQGDRATPTAADNIYQSFLLSDSTGVQTEFARISAVASVVTNTSEQGRLWFYIQENGTLTNKLVLSQSFLFPNTNDTLGLGQGANAFSDLFLASGGVINFNNGNATLTHSAGLLTSNVPLSLGTSNALTAGTIELGAATDTTISRSAAGKIAVEGVDVLTVAGGTMTGSIILGENTGLALDPAGSADGKWSGITIAGTAGYTQAFGDLVYLAVADSRWELSDADAEATAGYVMLGMVVSAGTDGTACTILLQGTIRADAKFPALTVGKQVFVGETAGAIQVAIPTGADNVIRSVGFALTADEIYFNPSQDYQLSVA